MPITFDPAARRVILDSATVTAQEIYSRWCDWIAVTDNAKYLPTFRAVGGDDLGSGLSIPPYYFLLNGWRVRPMEAEQTLVITGNLFVDGGGDPIVPTLGPFNVLVKSVVPVQAQGIATGAGITAQDKTDIINGTWAKALEGVSAEEMMRLMMSILNGKVSGAGTGVERFRDLADTKDRVVATVDAAGNRLSIVRDPS